MVRRRPDRPNHGHAKQVALRDELSSITLVRLPVDIKHRIVPNCCPYVLFVVDMVAMYSNSVHTTIYIHCVGYFNSASLPRNRSQIIQLYQLRLSNRIIAKN